MSISRTYTPQNGPTSPQASYDPNPPTTAAFSPTSTSGYSATSKQRSTIIVHKKSPLLVATPPQITRALAHSHPFLLPLNQLAGLLTWSTSDVWESYLLVAAFWAITLYGDFILRFLSPVLVVTLLILGMYSRRYSPLSSTSKTGDKHSRKRSDSSTSHKSLDEILDDLTLLTSRFNILLGPFLSLTDFLSTQTTPTSATTRPALTTLFIRILLITPLWVALTFPTLHILTSRRIILLLGTIVLTWHSRPARVTRALVWRSLFIRRLSTFLTGLDFSTPNPQEKADSPFGAELTQSRSHQAASALANTTSSKARSSGVRFTFILYENQRRWIGLGWTTSLFAYERGPWTDEHLNPAPSKDEFELPEVESGKAKWQWAGASDWRIERGDAKKHARSASKASQSGASGSKDGSEEDGGGWIYYDNRWEDGRSEDGWGRYARRRKWFRDAELVEADELDTGKTPVHQQATKQKSTSDDEDEKLKKAREYAAGLTPATPTQTSSISSNAHSQPIKIPQTDATRTTSAELDPSSASASASAKSPSSKKGWFRRGRSDSKSSSSKNTQITQTSTRSREDPEEDYRDKWREQDSRHRGFSVQEDIQMALG